MQGTGRRGCWGVGGAWPTPWRKAPAGGGLSTSPPSRTPPPVPVEHVCHDSITTKEGGGDTAAARPHVLGPVHGRGHRSPFISRCSQRAMLCPNLVGLVTIVLRSDGSYSSRVSGVVERLGSG